MSLMSLCETQSGSFSKPYRTLRHLDNMLHTVYWTSVQPADTERHMICLNEWHDKKSLQVQL